jgi:hypothetical protein
MFMALLQSTPLHLHAGACGSLAPDPTGGHRQTVLVPFCYTVALEVGCPVQERFTVFLNRGGVLMPANLVGRFENTGWAFTVTRYGTVTGRWTYAERAGALQIVFGGGFLLKHFLFVLHRQGWGHTANGQPFHWRVENVSRRFFVDPYHHEG